MDKHMTSQHRTPPTARKRTAGEKGRDPYDGLRPWSAYTHGLGVLLGLVGAVLLLGRVWSAGVLWRLVPFGVYLVSMVGLYTASTLYHCLNTSVQGRINLRKYDHISIYYLIAGSYAPICLVGLPGTLGYVMLGIIWALAIGGTVLALRWITAPRWLTAGIYLFMGWMAMFAIVPLWRVLPSAGMFWLLLGGIMYTVGGVLYAIKWPGRHNPRFGCHEIFHVFILLGSIAHFFLMYQVIALM